MFEFSVQPDPNCRKAARSYVELLAAAGFPIVLEETSATPACRLEWRSGGPAEPLDPFEDDLRDDPRSPDHDSGAARLLRHYGRNAALLACDPELAGRWLKGRRSSKRSGRDASK